MIVAKAGVTIFERKREESIGSRYMTKDHGEIEIVDYKGFKKVSCKFLDTGNIILARMDKILTGGVRDRLRPDVYGVGILGLEISKGSVDKYAYKMWYSMLGRCYSERIQRLHPTYNGCSVSENFLYFPYFKTWLEKQVGYGTKGFDLDKDLLVKGNKIYSEETCVLIPQEINTFLLTNKKRRGECLLGVSKRPSGRYSAGICTDHKKRLIGTFDTEYEAFCAYKSEKERYASVLAHKWKGKVDDRVCEALFNFNVEITD